MVYSVVALAVVFGVLRFVLPVSGGVNKADIYKDLAHVFVGFAFGVGTGNSVAMVVAVALTILEVIAFFVRKKRNPA